MVLAVLVTAVRVLLPTDPVPVEELYYNRNSNAADTAKWIAKRGSSKLEGYHSHLHDVLSGNNYSSELAWTLLTLFNFRWNVKRAVENGGQEDMGSFNLWNVEAINKLAAELDAPCPHPGFSMVLPKSTGEVFGPKYCPPWTPQQMANMKADCRQQDDQMDAPGGPTGTVPMHRALAM